MSINSVSSISYNRPSFKGGSDSKNKQEIKKEEAPMKETDKKTGGGWKAFASTLIPGLGQLIDGRYAPAVTFFSIFTAGHLITKSLIIKNLDSTNPLKTVDNMGASKKLTYTGVSIATLVSHIYNIYDAYKGKRVKQDENL